MRRVQATSTCPQAAANAGRCRPERLCNRARSQTQGTCAHIRTPRRRHRRRGGAPRENSVAFPANTLPPPRPRRRPNLPPTAADRGRKHRKAPKIVTSGHSMTPASALPLAAARALPQGHAETVHYTPHASGPILASGDMPRPFRGRLQPKPEHAPPDRPRSPGRKARTTRATGDIP
jgi:hypothetical protein